MSTLWPGLCTDNLLTMKSFLEESFLANQVLKT